MRVWKILSSRVSLAMQVCAGSDKNFVVINQKGIDPPSLDLLARAGVTNSDLFLHDGSNLLTFNLDLFGVPVKNLCDGVTS